jgi:hypothetical protein
MSARDAAAMKALRLLQQIASTSVFGTYSGHLLLAFWLVGTTSRSCAIREAALGIGRERALYWRARWPNTKQNLHCDNLLQEVMASHAATQLGITTADIRRDLRSTMRALAPEELLYYNPIVAGIPEDVPEECRCGSANARNQTHCATCRCRLDQCSKYEIWYYALMSAFFCERQRMPLGVTVVDVLKQLVSLRPLPRPEMNDYYQSIYAVTHFVYALTHYGVWRVSRRWLPEEYRFLRAALEWALVRGQPDTVGEVVDALATCGAADDDPLLLRARAFLLQTQDLNGGWGDEDGDEYAYFHTVWTGLDGLREYRVRRYLTLGPVVQRAIHGRQAGLH